MRMIAESISSLMPMSTSSTCACTVTSRAVVGSSAMSRSGLQVIAMAIIARWRMPPENSCGYMLARLAASGMPTRSSISTARFSASFLLRPSWIRAISPIWRPMVCTGFRAVSGILEDHGDLAAADLAPLLLAHREEVAGLPEDLAARPPRWWGGARGSSSR